MSDMLGLALKARLPFVRVSTDDPDQVLGIIDHLSDRSVVDYRNCSHVEVEEGVVGIVDGDLPLSSIDYDDCLEQATTVVWVNMDEPSPMVRDCGALVPPVDFLAEQLAELIGATEADQLCRYFVGMAMRDVVETVMLTQARDGELSPKGINQTKSYLGAGLMGLEALDTGSADSYVPPVWVEHWLKNDAQLLDMEGAKDLWPKGFMLDGPSGTGKTEMARYIAAQLGWPLYRLDLGSVYSRWQGESEANLRRALSFISNQGEAVFLLDEAEKLFGNDSAGQASLSTLLSMLLWWLQGETNRTITVMTCNDISVIPPELYRPGRLDERHTMWQLEGDSAIYFANQIADQLAEEYGLDPSTMAVTLEDRPMSHAEIVQRVRAAVKKNLLEADYHEQG